MKTSKRIVMVLWSIAVLPVLAQAPKGPEATARQEPKKVVATADGKQITAQQAWGMISMVAPPARMQYAGKLPKLLEQLYLQRVVAEEAVGLGLDKQPPWRDQIIRTRMSAQNFGNYANDPNIPPAVRAQMNNTIQRILWNAYFARAKTKEERTAMVKQEREKHSLTVVDPGFFN